MSEKKPVAKQKSAAPGSATSKKTTSKNATSKYQPRATSSRSTYILGGVALVVIAALVVGGILWNSRRDKGGVDEAVLNSNAALIIGQADAPRTIDIFEDFMCPYCKQFEQQSGSSIVKAINDGTLRVRYHILTFLNRSSASKDYSSRAAGAAQCVAEDEKREVFLKFHSALFAQQPSEGGSTDFSNADLARIAAEQGAGPATQKCITDGAKVAQAEQAAEQSTKQLSKATGGQGGTPTVLSGGTPVDGILDGTAWLDKMLSGSAN